MAARLFKSGTYSSLISEATDVIAQMNFNIIDINEKEKKMLELLTASKQLEALLQVFTNTGVLHKKRKCLCKKTSLLLPYLQFRNLP